MASRSNWKGYLKLSLVSASIAIYPATSSSEKVRFNTLNRATGMPVIVVGASARPERPSP
jgi:DNA end-binding protein Ku